MFGADGVCDVLHLEIKLVYMSLLESRGNGMGQVGLLVEWVDLGVGMIHVVYSACDWCS